MYLMELNMSSMVDHIAILVNDLRMAEKWYIEKVGGEVTHRQENYIRIKLENTNLALLDTNFITSKPHVGILCKNIKDLPGDGTLIKHRDGTTGVYVRDPFGNDIEFIYYSEQSKNFLN
jgi:catechol 2,3-dioxygenase-like lactoylglutathione lyase family enzyme